MKKYLIYIVLVIVLVLIGQKGIYGDDLLSGPGILSAAVRLTSGEGEYRYGSPQWSPQGDWILFGSRDPGGKIERGQTLIWIMRPDGSEIKKIANGGLEQWNLDGTKVIFVDPVNEVNKDYRVIETDLSGNTREVIALTGQFVIAQWSLDVKKIAVLEIDPDRPAKPREFLLKVITPDGKKIWDTILIENLFPYVFWSPDSKKIAYFKVKPRDPKQKIREEVQGNLWVFDILTGIHTQITQSEDIRLQGTGQIWSRDGNGLIFVRTRPDGGSTIWQINLDGTNAKEILAENMQVSGVSFSPDRTKILYKTPLGLYVTTSQGGQSNIVALGKMGSYSCSPDSKKVAFEMEGNIWVINIP